MKKILISIFLTYILTLSAYTAEIKDCSLYSKFNPKYLVCKTVNFIEDTTEYQNKEWSKEKN